MFIWIVAGFHTHIQPLFECCFEPSLWGKTILTSRNKFQKHGFVTGDFWDPVSWQPKGSLGNGFLSPVHGMWVCFVLHYFFKESRITCMPNWSLWVLAGVSISQREKKSNFGTIPKGHSFPSFCLYLARTFCQTYFNCGCFPFTPPGVIVMD